MKTFGKLWWIFGLADVTATFLNPYVGFFGLFNIVALFCTFCLDVNLIARERELKRNRENGFVNIQYKSLIFSAYFISVIFFLMKMFVCLIIFIVAYSDKQIAAPYQIWSNPDLMSIILLIVGIIFNVLSLVSYICRGKVFRNMVKEYEQMNAKMRVDCE